MLINSSNLIAIIGRINLLKDSLIFKVDLIKENEELLQSIVYCIKIKAIEKNNTEYYCTMKKVIQILKLVSGILLGIIFMLIILPFILIVKPFVWFGNRIRRKQFQNYLKQLEGKNFFCYNNKSNSLEYLRQHIIPNLPASVEVIFLNGKKPESDYERKFISHALYKLKDYQGFPHLLKVRNGNAIDKSLNNELFNTINQNKPVEELMLKIIDFFEESLKKRL